METFLLGSSLVALLLVQVLKELFTKVSARWGALIAQVLLLVVSIVVAGIGILFGQLSPRVLETVIAVFGSAMVMYEVFYKAIYQKAILGGGSID